MKTKLITTIMITLFLASMLSFISTANAHTEADPFRTDLIADGGDPSTAVDVGDVLVWNDENYLYVKYVTTDDWYITEVHLHVADSPTGIPQSNGNPVPGKFTYGEKGLWTQEYEFYPIELTWPVGNSLYIAAHAKVQHPEEFWIVSDGQTIVKERRSGDMGSFSTVNAPAVYAWEPGPNYPNDGPDDSGWQAYSLWDQRILLGYHAFFESRGADWIWETYRVSDPVYGTVLKFERSFQINGYPAGGTLIITCDNGYSASLNGFAVGSDNVADDWLLSDLKQAYVDTSDWDTVEVYDVSGYLKSGMNTLHIDAANEYFDTDDYGNPWTGTASNNPAGLIFALCVNYYREETAWGAGEAFPGRNWATYFTYDVQGWALRETITVPANNPAGVVSSIVLDVNKQYKFVVTGIYWENKGGTPHQLCDAEYTTYETEDWSPYHDGCVGYTSGWLADWTELGVNFGDLQVNGAFIYWGSFSASHEYTYIFGTGAGFPVNFRIFDGYGNTNTKMPSWYGDNEGSLTVEIYEWG